MSHISIQYHKNFSVFERFSNTDQASTNSRIYSLLSQLGLEKCIVCNGESLKLSNIDYMQVYKSLSLLRKDSMIYLKSALKGKRNV